VDPNWDYISDGFNTRADATWNGAKFAVNAEDLGHNHMMCVTFEAN